MSIADDIDDIFAHTHQSAAQAAGVIAQAESALATLPPETLEAALDGIARATADKESLAKVIATVMTLAKNAPAIAALFA